MIKKIISLLFIFTLMMSLGACGSNSSSEKMEFEQLEWPTYENAKQIPIPKSTIADVRNNNDVRFEFYLANTTLEDYKDYIEECKAKGFTLESIEQENRYYAFNEAKYELTVQHQEGDIMYVCVVEERYDIEIKLLHSNKASAGMYNIRVEIDGYWEEDSKQGDEAIAVDAYIKEGNHTLIIENDDDDDINGRIDFYVSEDGEYFEFEINCLSNKIEIFPINNSTSKTSNVDSSETALADTTNTNNQTPTVADEKTSKNDTYEVVIPSGTKGKKFTKFQTQYEESLIPILNENSLDLICIEYTPLVPDYELDYYEIDRINEYEVKVYISGTVSSYEEIYDIIIDIRCANNYLLSNKYEILSSGAYVDDDCKEKGFHQVYTTLIFEDDTSYKIDYISLLENNEVVWKQDRKPVTEESMVNQADAAGWDCMYEDCDRKRADGRLYCHIHKCNEPGCMHETSPFQDYCEEHRKKK